MSGHIRICSVCHHGSSSLTQSAKNCNNCNWWHVLYWKKDEQELFFFYFKYLKPLNTDCSDASISRRHKDINWLIGHNVFSCFLCQALEMLESRLKLLSGETGLSVEQKIAEIQESVRKAKVDVFWFYSTNWLQTKSPISLSEVLLLVRVIHFYVSHR